MSKFERLLDEKKLNDIEIDFIYEHLHREDELLNGEYADKLGNKELNILKRLKSLISKLSIGDGDYIKFGTYYDEPILWKVIDLDKYGDPLLCSERILTLKAFDSAGDYHEDISDRRSRGSNYWKDSNIRQWLNSSEESINWIQNEPNVDNVWDRHNPYENEAGFLSNNNFGKEERALIKTSINETEYDKLDGKGSYTTNDKVFFLSESEYNNYENQRLIGPRKPTRSAVKNSNYTDRYLSHDMHWHNWLRSPSSASNNVRYVDSSGSVYDNSARHGHDGVSPALFLNLKSEIFKSGEGTENNPYII